MKEYLGRSATEFGMYFLLFPIGFPPPWSRQTSQRASLETMVLAGSVIHILAVASQSASILAGAPPLVISFGFFATFGQEWRFPMRRWARFGDPLWPERGGIGVSARIFSAQFLHRFTPCSPTARRYRWLPPCCREPS
jgi:DHA1 family bicyclomycin/chloramphenicol resistance-like MFS transporter